MKKWIFLLSVSFIFISVVVLAEDTPPDLVGEWRASFNGVSLGKLDHLDAAGSPVFIKNAGKIVTVIEKQEGNMFYGYRQSAKKTERFVGFLDPDGRGIYIADEDGIYIGEMRGGQKMFLRYLESTRDSQVAGYGLYEKVK